MRHNRKNVDCVRFEILSINFHLSENELKKLSESIVLVVKILMINTLYDLNIFSGENNISELDPCTVNEKKKGRLLENTRFMKIDAIVVVQRSPYLNKQFRKNCKYREKPYLLGRVPHPLCSLHI